MPELEDREPIGTYSARSLDLVRFQNDPLDGKLGEMLDRVDLSRRLVEDFRRRVDREAALTLIHYAHRSAAAAIRSREPLLSLRSVRAQAVAPREFPDLEDRNVEFSIFAAQECQATFQEVKAIASLADERVAELLVRRAKVMPNLMLVDCGFVPVISKYGLGFMERWGQASPSSELMANAVGIADAIDSGTRYEVESIHLAALPAVWFGIEGDRRGEIRSSGCVTIGAALPGEPYFGNSLICFLADIGDHSAAENLARLGRAAATPERPRAFRVMGPYLLAAIGGSSREDRVTAETGGSMQMIVNRVTGWQQ